MNDLMVANGRSRAVAVAYEVSDIELMARAIAGSKLFGIANPDQALALCLIAQSEGRHPASAAQDYHIIQGKPSKKADAMLRDFLSAGGKVEWHKLDDTTADATFSHPAGGSVRITWDMPRAKKAQLTTPMWTKYPRQMLRSRVVSEGVRTVFPMATSGMYVPEEVQDFAPASSNEVATVEADQVTPVKRIRDGSDGQPKSSRQAKLSGDWDIAKELEPITSVAALEEWRAQNEDRIAKLPKAWRESLEQEIYEPKLEELKRAADAPAKLNAADSAKVKGILTRSLDMCKDAASVDEWQAKNRDVFRSMTRADQEEVVRERDARLAEMFKPSDDEQPDEDGVFADDEQNILMAG